MAQGGKTPTSFEEGLNGLYQDAGALALANDISPQGMQFVQMIQQGILKFRQAMQQEKAQRAAQLGQQAAGLGQQGGQGGPGGPGGGMMGGGGGGMGPAGAQGGGPPGQGAAPGGPPQQGQQIAPGGGPGMSGYGGVASNPDELRRVLAGTGGVGNAT